MMHRHFIFPVSHYFVLVLCWFICPIVVFLQVTGRSSVTAAALVIPFLVTAALASTTSNQIAAKYDIVRPPFLIGLAILPIGMVRRSIPLTPQRYDMFRNVRA